MLAIRGTYDGKKFKPIPTERLPMIEGEVPVVILFLQDVGEEQKRQIEIANRMRAARDAMPPLDVSVKDLVEEGREP